MSSTFQTGTDFGLGQVTSSNPIRLLSKTVKMPLLACKPLAMLYKQRKFGKILPHNSQLRIEFGSLCSHAVNIDKCLGRVYIKRRPIVRTHGKRAEPKISIIFISLQTVEWLAKTEIITKLFSTTS